MIDTFGEIGHSVDYFDNEFANGFTSYFKPGSQSQYNFGSIDKWSNPKYMSPYCENGEINIRNLYPQPVGFIEN